MSYRHRLHKLLHAPECHSCLNLMSVFVQAHVQTNVLSHSPSSSLSNCLRRNLSHHLLFLLLLHSRHRANLCTPIQMSLLKFHVDNAPITLIEDGTLVTLMQMASATTFLSQPYASRFLARQQHAVRVQHSTFFGDKGSLQSLSLAKGSLVAWKPERCRTFCNCQDKQRLLL